MNFEHYDEAFAARQVGADASIGGVPAFFGFDTVEVGPGRLVCELDVRDELITPFGSAHGGVMAALVDHVLGSVCYPVIPRGAWAATTEFKLNLLAAVRGGRLRAEATIVSLTKRTAVVAIQVHNGDRLACVAQGTVLIVEQPNR